MLLLAISFSLVVTFLVSKYYDKVPEDNRSWESTLSIINPLTPWIAQFEKELNTTEGERYVDIPSSSVIIEAFKSWWYISLGVPSVITILLMIVVPLALTAEHFTLGKCLVV